MCDGIERMVKTINHGTFKERLISLANLRPPGAYITALDTIRFGIRFDPLAFYVSAGDSSQLFADHIALAVQKDSELKNIFDNL